MDSAMQRFAARWLALLAGITALSSGCIGGASETTPTRTALEEKMNGSSDLHRPLHLPTVAPGAACPQTPGARPNPDVAIALGSGPAYPVLGFEGNPIPPKPPVPLHAEDRKGNVYWHKTLWAVDPAYDGPVLIRGAGIDTPRAIWFAYHKRRLRELEFRRQKSDSWRYGPSFTLLPGPGCYAFQVDGTSFSDVIVFEAAQAPTA
jgi:hypothetical protein